MLRRRLLLVDQRASHRTSLQSLLARHTGKRLSEGQLRKLDAQNLQYLLPIPCASLLATTLLSMIQSTTEAIDLLERAVSAHCIEQPAYQLVTGIGGIDKVLGATMAAPCAEGSAASAALLRAISRGLGSDRVAR